MWQYLMSSSICECSHTICFFNKLISNSNVVIYFSNFLWVGGSIRLVLYFLPCGVDCSLYLSWFFLLSHSILLVCLGSSNKVSYLYIKKKNRSPVLGSFFQKNLILIQEHIKWAFGFCFWLCLYLLNLSHAVTTFWVTNY